VDLAVVEIVLGVALSLGTAVVVAEEYPQTL